VAVSLSGFLFTAQDGFGKFVNTTFLILYATGWLLLGFALVTGQESAEEPRLSI
jgi:hypothetical protein